jgi:hypothetical protein
MQAAGNLLKQLGIQIGLDGLGLNDEGHCSLAFDESIVVTFVADPDEGLNAVSFIGTVPNNDTSARMLSAILESNFLPSNNGGARFALEPNSDRLVLVHRWDAMHIDLNGFTSQLEAYVNAVDAAQKMIEQGLPSTGAGSADSQPGLPSGATFA